MIVFFNIKMTLRVSNRRPSNFHSRTFAKDVVGQSTSPSKTTPRSSSPRHKQRCRRPNVERLIRRSTWDPILTLMFRKCSGNVPGNVLFLTLVPEWPVPGTFPRPVPGTFPGPVPGTFPRLVPGTFREELFLELAPKLLRARKEKHMSYGAKAYRARIGRCFCVVSRYFLAPRPFASVCKSNIYLCLALVRDPGV